MSLLTHQAISEDDDDGNEIIYGKSEIFGK